MNIAIIGAGFAGLSTAHFLLEEGPVSITIFDAKGVGAGASGVCSGLLHPYPGLAARRSQNAHEALLIAKELLKIAEAHTPKQVAARSGILRTCMDSKQREQLHQAINAFGDVEHLEGDTFLIHSGITVHSENYLEGLFASLKKKGVVLEIRKIETLKELEHFDRIVIAAGFGVRAFPECKDLNIKFMKGQSFRMKGRLMHPTSHISKGYIAHLGCSDYFDLGSSYEREFVDDLPNEDVAKKYLQEKIDALVECSIILECRAGVRVCNRSHYLPLIAQLNEKAYVFTALGSRGLLYHGLYGRSLSRLLLSKSEKR